MYACGSVLNMHVRTIATLFAFHFLVPASLVLLFLYCSVLCCPFLKRLFLTGIPISPWEALQWRSYTAGGIHRPCRTAITCMQTTSICAWLLATHRGPLVWQVLVSTSVVRVKRFPTSWTSTGRPTSWTMRQRESSCRWACMLIERCGG